MIVEFMLSIYITAISGQIQGFVKGGAYFSSRSLKQRVWGSPPGSIGLFDS